MNVPKIEEILNEKITNCVELGSGMCNTVYKITTENNNLYCVKIIKTDGDVKESNTLLVEAKITQALNLKDLLLPILKIVYIDSNGKFYIYKFVDSTPLGEGDNDKYASTLLAAVGEFHSNIKCLDKNTVCNEIGIKEYTFDDFFDKYGVGFDDYAINEKLPKDYRSILQTALRIYNENKNFTTHEQLLHNDIHGENIFIDKHGNLDCVIDFGDAVWGDVHLDMMWYVHGYPNDFTKAIDSYEKISGHIINKPFLISLACIRFTMGLCKWYIEGVELEHCNEKFEDYKRLYIEYLSVFNHVYGKNTKH